MKSEYSKLFRVLDGYAKRHHSCHLTELFLNEEGDEYIVCFRPLEMEKGRADQTICRYLRIGIGEAKVLAHSGLLTTSIANILDEQLPQLFLPNKEF